jgi:tRNA(His) guanylyltransferase
MDSLGDRMKRNYEAPSRHLLTRRMPVIIRCDGRAFHTLTRGMTKPFDTAFMDAMTTAAAAVAEEAQGCVAAYVASDEASFLLIDYATLTTEAWFGYVKSKIESAAASTMTLNFHLARRDRGTKLATFDARAFNIPREEVVNYFVWRMKDWERNSLQMLCQSLFSHKELQNKNAAAMHEMLHGIGRNWATDLSMRARNGTWIFVGNERDTSVLPSYDSVACRLGQLIDPVTQPLS